MRTLQKALVATLVAGAVIGSAGPALAYDGTATVSCSTDHTATLVTLNGGGTSTVRQNSTHENSNLYYWGVSSNGNELSHKATTDGHSVSWTGVTTSNYTWKARIVSGQNCNGILPGNGNTSLSYTITP